MSVVIMFMVNYIVGWHSITDVIFILICSIRRSFLLHPYASCCYCWPNNLAIVIITSHPEWTTLWWTWLNYSFLCQFGLRVFTNKNVFVDKDKLMNKTGKYTILQKIIPLIALPGPSLMQVKNKNTKDLFRIQKIINVMPFLELLSNQILIQN